MTSAFRYPGCSAPSPRGPYPRAVARALVLSRRNGAARRENRPPKPASTSDAARGDPCPLAQNATILARRELATDAFVPHGRAIFGRTDHDFYQRKRARRDDRL